MTTRAEPMVLVVDDEEKVRRALVRNIRPLDCPVVAVESGEAALTWLRANTASVIIADYNMPVMNGIDFLREAKNLQPKARRVMLTGVAGGAVRSARGRIIIGRKRHR